MPSEEAANYWYETYHSIAVQLKSLPSDRVCYTSYENLLEAPEETTFQLFKFIGSNQPVGVSEYTRPDSGNWKWGRDDGSSNIHTMTVQSTRKQHQQAIKIDASDDRLAAMAMLSHQYRDLIEQCERLNNLHPAPLNE